MSKYDNIRKIIRWCSTNRGRSFHYHNVRVSPTAISALCDSTYRGKIWLVRRGKASTRDGNNGLMTYSLASWVDVDKVFR